MTAADIGIVLINLGTPESCDRRDIRSYLREFLSDGRVVTLPSLCRWLLVNGLIVPFRARQTQRYYEAIWTEAGSPLRVHSVALADELQKVLGRRYRVVCGMRYGTPSISSAWSQVRGCRRVLVLPLYPQYASATTGSAVEAFLSLLSSEVVMPSVVLPSSFYQSSEFCEAWAHQVRSVVSDVSVPTYLFSYHSVPVSSLRGAGCEVVCDQQQACPRNGSSSSCYRSMCYETTRGIVSALGVSESQAVTMFQSRFSKRPWAGPFAEDVLARLRSRGVRDVVVSCPAFVADCVETLEEVHIRLRAEWARLGGDQFVCVPCLNAAPVWVSALASMVRRWLSVESEGVQYAADCVGDT